MTGADATVMLISHSQNAHRSIGLRSAVAHFQLRFYALKPLRTRCWASGPLGQYPNRQARLEPSAPSSDWLQATCAGNASDPYLPLRYSRTLP